MPGSSHESTRIVIVRSGCRAPIAVKACLIHAPTGIVSAIRRLRTRLAISHAVIGETCRSPPTIARRASSVIGSPFASHSSAHVSSKSLSIDQAASFGIPLLRWRRQIDTWHNRHSSCHAAPGIP